MGLLAQISYFEAAVVLLLFSALYVAVLTIHRLFFSPIAGFPGPLLARTTFWYEFYYDWVHTGQYFRRINEMHRKYGPIVRVTPHELHISEPEFYGKLFVTGAVRKSDTYPRFSRGTGFEDMAAVSKEHDMHRMTRAPLDPFFNKAGILRVEPRVLQRVQKLCRRLEGFKDTGEVVNFSHALGSLANDIISSTLFENPSDYLGDPTFNETWFDTLKKGTMTVPLLAHLPWVARALAMPAVRAAAERLTNWRVWDDRLRRQLLTSKLRPADEAKTRDNTTFFDQLVHSEVVESCFGNGGFARLGQLMQQAGSHNVSHTTGSIIVYLALDKARENNIREAIAPLFNQKDPGETPTWHELDKVSYLQACILEGLRIAIGAMFRSTRIAPEVDLQFHEWTIPKGTPVAMSSYWMHMDPDVFPNPRNFEPERWLCNDPEKLKVMHSYSVPFSKGSRDCIGKNLVRMQMSHVLAHLYRPGAPEIKLYKTDKSDIVAIHALLYPWQRLDSKGIRALIVSRGDDKEESEGKLCSGNDDQYEEKTSLSLVA